eukprot:Awhi_evm1s778
MGGKMTHFESMRSNFGQARPTQAYGLFALPLTLLIPEPGPGNRTSDMDGY